MLRRSDFIAATYALSLVFANFGIAIAARMPMMTTTIRSSMRVKPFLLLIASPKALVEGGERRTSAYIKTRHQGFRHRKTRVAQPIGRCYLNVSFEVATSMPLQRRETWWRSELIRSALSRQAVTRKLAVQ